jgi:5-methylcytosine-specific restriction endonuclease McrA
MWGIISQTVIGDSMSRERRRIPYHQIPKQPHNPNQTYKTVNYHPGYGQRKHRRYQRFRNTVLERDNHTCQICKGNKELIVAHIEKYAENVIRRCDPNNAITLCLECEKRFNNEYPLQRPHDMFAYIRRYNGLKLMYRVSNRYHNTYRDLVPVLMKHTDLIKGVMV